MSKTFNLVTEPLGDDESNIETNKRIKNIIREFIPSYRANFSDEKLVNLKKVMNVIKEIAHVNGMNYVDNDMLVTLAHDIETGLLSDEYEFDFEVSNDCYGEEIKNKLETLTEEEHDEYVNSPEFQPITREVEITYATKLYNEFYSLMSKILQTNLATRIYKLDFGGFATEPDITAWKAMMDVIAENKHLTHLKLRVDAREAPEVGVALWQVFKINKTITSLSLDDLHFDGTNGVANEQAISGLFSILREANTLRELSIKTRAPEDGGLYVCEGLTQLLSDQKTELLRLTLISCECSAMLTKAIFNNRSLTYLDFDNNYLDWNFKNPDNPFGILPSMLEHNHSLLTLKLGRPFSVCYSEVARALKVNKTLTNLSMWRGVLSKEACNALADALAVNNTLNNLNLIHGGDIRESEALILNHLIPGLLINRGLTSFMIGGSKVAKSVFASFSDALINVVKTNRNLIKLSSYQMTSDDRYDGTIANFTPHLVRNQKLHRNWLHVILLAKFMAANSKSKDISTCIIPLIPNILNFTNEDKGHSLLTSYEPKSSIFNNKTLSQFMTSRYFQSQLESLTTLVELTVTEKNVITASSSSSSSSSMSISELDEKANVADLTNNVTSNESIANSKKRRHF